MPPSLRTLLERHELRLRLLSDEAELAPGALDEPVQWVHSSDLIDPTPFLDEQQLLLTTGTQFEAGHDDPRTADDYVGRLRARRLTGVGFGNEVIRSGPPESLIAACRRHGIPL